MGVYDPLADTNSLIVATVTRDIAPFQTKLESIIH
jgi:hypothetical protein